MSNKQQVSLVLLKKLVGELETSLNIANNISADTELQTHEFISELARASGLANVVMQEAHLLVKDIYQLIRWYQTPTSAEAEIFQKIFDPASVKDKN